MQKADKIGLFWFLFILGAGVSLTNLFAPVHELGHWLYARYQGDPATFNGWSAIKAAPNISHAVAGWHFEVFAFCVAGWLLGSGSGFWRGGFFIGHAVSSAVRAYTSYDMNEYATQVMQLEGLSGYDITDILLTIKGRWTIMICVWLGLSALVVYRWHKKA